jgi:hypothetical protein
VGANLYVALFALAVAIGSMGWAITVSARSGQARRLELATSVSWFDVGAGLPGASEAEVVTVTIWNTGRRRATVTSVGLEDVRGRTLCGFERPPGTSLQLTPGGRAEYFMDAGVLAKSWREIDGRAVVVAIADGRRYFDPLDPVALQAIEAAARADAAK